MTWAKREPYPGGLVACPSEDCESLVLPGTVCRFCHPGRDGKSGKSLIKPTQPPAAAGHEPPGVNRGPLSPSKPSGAAR